MTTTQPGLAITSIHNHLHVWSYPTTGERDKKAMEYATGNFAQSIDLCDVLTLGWATPNRQSIETGCKVFDRQTSSVITGNVIANTMFSWLVRPRSETKCNGFTFAHGQLQKSDLQPFASNDLQAGALIRYINNLPLAEEQTLILTVVFHNTRTHGRKSRVIHGGLLTDTLLRQVRRFDRDELGKTWRATSCKIMDAVVPHLTDQKAINRVPFKLH